MARARPAHAARGHDLRVVADTRHPLGRALSRGRRRRAARRGHLPLRHARRAGRGAVRRRRRRSVQPAPARRRHADRRRLGERPPLLRAGPAEGLLTERDQRMLIARAAMMPMVASESTPWVPMMSFAECVSGIVSVGLKAVEFVTETYR